MNYLILVLAGVAWFVMLLGSFGALADTVPSPPAAPAELQWQGITLVSFIFACVGAVLGITWDHVPPLTRQQACFAMLSGLVCGVTFPSGVELVVQHYWQLPVPTMLNNALAIVFGIGGMYIVPLVIGFWKDPWALLDRFRGTPPSGGA